MKKLLLILLILCCSTISAQTKPNWKGINGIPFESVTAYGAKGDGVTDDTIPVNRAFATGSAVYFPAGHYIGDFVASAGRIIQGAGPNATILTAKTAGRAALVFSNNTQWNYSTVKGIQFTGAGRTRNGVGYETEITGRTRFEQCSFVDCDKGLDRSKGNIGVSIESCQFSDNNIGMYNIGSAISEMHAGCVDINMSHFDNNDVACIYIDDTYPVVGQFAVRNSTIETNEGHGIYSANFSAGAKTKLYLDSLWLEVGDGVPPPANVTTPDGATNLRTELFLHNTTATIKNFRLLTLNASGSTIDLDNCGVYYAQVGAWPSDVAFQNSRITWTNRVDQWAGHVDGLTLSYAGAGFIDLDFTYLGVQQIPHRSFLTTGFAAHVRTAVECASTTAYIDSSDTIASGTFDGILFDRSLVMVATTSIKILDWSGLGTHNALATGTYNVWSLAVRRNNTGAESTHSKLHIFSSNAGGYIAGPAINNLPSAEWVTVGGIFVAQRSSPTSFHLGMVGHGALLPGNYSISGFQCVAFSTFQEAHAYFLSGAFSRSSDGY